MQGNLLVGGSIIGLCICTCKCTYAPGCVYGICCSVVPVVKGIADTDTDTSQSLGVSVLLSFPLVSENTYSVLQLYLGY